METPDTATICFENGKILRGVKEGYKRYDANDKLLEEVADLQLNDKQLEELLKGLKEQYLYDLKKADDRTAAGGEAETGDKGSDGENKSADGETEKAAGNDSAGECVADEKVDMLRYVLGIEMVTDDITGVDADSYQLLVCCSDMKVSWARYLNRISQ